MQRSGFELRPPECEANVPLKMGRRLNRSMSKSPCQCWMLHNWQYLFACIVLYIKVENISFLWKITIAGDGLPRMFIVPHLPLHMSGFVVAFKGPPVFRYIVRQGLLRTHLKPDSHSIIIGNVALYIWYQAYE